MDACTRWYLLDQIRSGTFGTKEQRGPHFIRRHAKVMSVEVCAEEDELTLLPPPSVLAATRSRGTRTSTPTSTHTTLNIHCIRTNRTFLRVKVASDPTASSQPPLSKPIRMGVADTEGATVDAHQAKRSKMDLQPDVTHSAGTLAAAGGTTSVREGDDAGCVITRGVVDLSGVPPSVIMTQVNGIIKDLWAIYAGKLPSWRHQAYRKKGKARADLKSKVRFGTYNDSQQEMFLDALTKTFCKKGTRYMNYVMDVLMPEAMTRVTSNLLQVSYDAAEVYLDRPASLDASSIGVNLPSDSTTGDAIETCVIND